MNKGLLSVFFLTAALAVGAQQPTSTPNELNSDASQDDILILVNLTAKELKFEAVPNPTVDFPGTPHRSTIWVTERQNLPDKVEPGVTYRNIGIQLRISSRFADIERIVKEALGEIPIADEPTAASIPRAPTLIAVAPPKPDPPRVRSRRRAARR